MFLTPLEKRFCMSSWALRTQHLHWTYIKRLHYTLHFKEHLMCIQFRPYVHWQKCFNQLTLITAVNIVTYCYWLLAWCSGYHNCTFNEAWTKFLGNFKSCLAGQDGESFWQWLWLEVKLKSFRQSTILQNQFITIIVIIMTLSVDYLKSDNLAHLLCEEGELLDRWNEKQGIALKYSTEVKRVWQILSK